MIIYMVTNLINGKIYVGKDGKNNPDYYGSGILIKKAIKKYGIQNFIKSILEFCTDEENLNERERYWIDLLDSRNPIIGYNISEGGDGFNLKNLPNYDEIKEKMDKSPHLKKSYVEKYGNDLAKEIIRKKSETYKRNAKTKGELNSSKRPDIREKISNGVTNFIKNNPDFIDNFKVRQKKIIDSIKGKTFDEIYGNEYANVIRKKLSDSKMGDLNPSKRDEVRQKIKEGVNKSLESRSLIPVWSFLNIETSDEFLVGRGKLKDFCQINDLSLSKIKYRLSKNKNFEFCGWFISILETRSR